MIISELVLLCDRNGQDIPSQDQSLDLSLSWPKEIAMITLSRLKITLLSVIVQWST